MSDCPDCAATEAKRQKLLKKYKARGAEIERLHDEHVARARELIAALTATLRDQFAMASISTRPLGRAGALAAEWAYQMADAMLKERKM